MAIKGSFAAEETEHALENNKKNVNKFENILRFIEEHKINDNSSPELFQNDDDNDSMNEEDNIIS
jgi:hypothetical protein